MLFTLLDGTRIARLNKKCNYLPLDMIKLKQVINMKEKKTNVMRILDQKKVSYHMFHYTPQGDFDVTSLAQEIGQDATLIYKTIVLESGVNHYVAVLPIEAHLDLKKVAKAFGIKNISLLHPKNLFDLTGYVRGGCSPLGMKKNFPTIVDLSAQAKDFFIVSAGKIGQQVGLNPHDLAPLIKASFADIQAHEPQSDTPTYD